MRESCTRSIADRQQQIQDRVSWGRRREEPSEKHWLFFGWMSSIRSAGPAALLFSCRRRQVESPWCRCANHQTKERRKDA